MPEVGLNREFLHRACVQFSSSLADKSSVEAEKQHTLRFVRLHAAMHVSEIARALVWRVVDTDDDKPSDRAGAWELLNAVIMECGEPKNDLSRTSLASKLLLFLPYLISHRWYTTVMAPVSVLNKHNTSVNRTHHKKGTDRDSDNKNNDDDDNDEDEGKNKKHSKSKKRRRSLSAEHNHKTDKAAKHQHHQHNNHYEEKEKEQELNQEHRQHKYQEAHNDVHTHPSHSSSEEEEEEEENKERRRHRQSTLNTTLALAGTGKVIPATIINGGEQVIVDIQQVRAFQLQYRKFLDTWKRVWRSDIYQGLREVVRQVEHHGHSLTEKAQEYLSIPATFKDSLWRLRKNNPRPATTLHMLYCYG